MSGFELFPPPKIWSGTSNRGEAFALLLLLDNALGVGLSPHPKLYTPSDKVDLTTSYSYIEREGVREREREEKKRHVLIT